MSIVVQYEDKLNYLQTLIDSKQLPKHINSPEAALLVDKMGAELGFPTIQAFHYIIPIQGRLTLSAKAIGAILRRHKVTFKTTEDCYFVYPNGDVKRVHSGDVQPVDKRTTIVFTRDGVDEEVSYNWTDAVAAGLTSKDNWKRMPK